MKILIFGVGGSGKTTLSRAFSQLITGIYINSDQVREKFDKDFDLSDEITETTHARRIRYLADGVVMAGKIAVIDYSCRTDELRQIIAPDYAVWMDTTPGENFERPDLANINYHVSAWFDDTHEELLKVIKDYIKKHPEVR